MKRLLFISLIALSATVGCTVTPVETHTVYVPATVSSEVPMNYAPQTVYVQPYTYYYVPPPVYYRFGWRHHH